MYIHIDYTLEDNLFTLVDSQRTDAQTHARIHDNIINEGIKPKMSVPIDFGTHGRAVTSFSTQTHTYK